MVKYVCCDIFDSGAEIICHQVNCRGAMNSGVAKQVRQKYPEVYSAYKDFFESAKKSSRKLLGEYQAVPVNDKLVIINMFSQDAFGYDGACYTDYDAIAKCLSGISQDFNGRTIALPYRIGCCRGGGDWSKVSQIIENAFGNSECTVLICKLDKDKV